MEKLLGYKRENGEYGVRNFLAIIPTVFCANHVVKAVASSVKGAVALPHSVGCGQHGADLDQSIKTLAGLGKNPNVGAVIVVGLGCERIHAHELAEMIQQSGKRAEYFNIQENGGSIKTIEKTVAMASDIASGLSAQPRMPFSISKLRIGLKCGGSDATSGIAANPALGCACDRIVGEGGTAILSEITELLGSEHILCRRAANEQVAKEIKDIIVRCEEILLQRTKNYSRTSEQAALITPGNFDGGVSSVAEKALGGIYKSGSSQFIGTLAYAETPSENGLYLMNSPSHDGEVVTSMVAGGAQIVIFTTGRGTPTGFPLAPVIKVTGNSKTYRQMKDNIDINSGAVIDGEKTLEEAGIEIYDEIIAVANGKMTKAEALNHDELFVIGRYELY